MLGTLGLIPALPSHPPGFLWTCPQAAGFPPRHLCAQRSGNPQRTPSSDCSQESGAGLALPSAPSGFPFPLSPSCFDSYQMGSSPPGPTGPVWVTCCTPSSSWYDAADSPSSPGETPRLLPVSPSFPAEASHLSGLHPAGCDLPPVFPGLSCSRAWGLLGPTSRFWLLPTPPTSPRQIQPSALQPQLKEQTRAEQNLEM